MGENRRRDIMNKYVLGLDLDGRAVLVDVKEDS